MDQQQLQDLVHYNVQSINTVWVLLCTFLVFFMQAGFGLVEVGFTRAKNASNIIMKNLIDLVVGSLTFWLFGYSLMFGEDVGGFIGAINFVVDPTEVSTTGIPEEASLMFQTVFAATAATIVSGAVAGRTKFTTYIVFSLLITGIIYPISGHWAWGGGWLSELGFLDFAGSTVVHACGGMAGLVGSSLIGPRIGKYVNGQPTAIPGHNFILGALGVFILWLGWFGFNPGTQLAAGTTFDPETGEFSHNATSIAHLVLTTNLSAAAGALATVFVTWIRYRKPDVTMSLNGALAGLVGITAGCDIVEGWGAVIIGLTSGIVVVFSIEFFDRVLKIDDPVGAISVHGTCGFWGTLLTGFFATDGGFFYGGGFGQVGVQLIGIAAIGGWSIAMSFIVFKVLQTINGLRVPEKIEIEGLDIHEHGQTAYN